MRKDQEKRVPSGSSSDSLVPYRLESLWCLEKLDKRVSIFPLFSQKKKCVKIQHQMEVLNPIYMAPNMTVLTKTFILHCVMKRDGVNRMFPFAK